MLDTDQIVPYVNIWDVFRAPVFHDWVGYAASDLPRLFPTLADFPDDGNLNRIQSATTFEGYFPNLVKWSTNPGQYPVNSADPNVIQLSTACVEQFAPKGSFTLVRIHPSHLSVEDFPQDGDVILFRFNV